MPLCFIEPQDAIRVIAESVGREARRQLLGELVRAWVDEIPEPELEAHYAKAVADLDEHDLSMLAAWHASLEVGHPIANREFLVNVFSSLGDNRREALKIAAGFRGEEAFDAGVAEEQALDTVLPFLSRERAVEGAGEGVPRALPLGPAGLRQLSRRSVGGRPLASVALRGAHCRIEGEGRRRDDPVERRAEHLQTGQDRRSMARPGARRCGRRAKRAGPPPPRTTAAPPDPRRLLSLGAQLARPRRARPRWPRLG